MGQRTKGDMWCDFCGGLVLGTKTTHRLRGAVIGATLIPSGLASAAFSRVEAYRCPNCGQRTRRATREDFARLSRWTVDQSAESEPLSTAAPDALSENARPASVPRKSPDARKRELRYLVDASIGKEFKVSLDGLLATFAPGRTNSPQARKMLAAELETAGLYIVEDLEQSSQSVTLSTDPSVPEPDLDARSSEPSPEVKRQLEELENFRAAGKLSDAEYEAISRRLLET